MQGVIWPVWLAFADFTDTYGADAILLVDTWDSIEGIIKAAAADSPTKGNEDMLKPFTETEDMQTINERLAKQLRRLPKPVKQIERPAQYPLEFDF